MHFWGENINVLITGGAGYIGSCLIPELLKKYRVKVLDNLMYSYNGILPHIGNPKFTFVKGDIRCKDDVKMALENVDVVIHLAAIVGYPACKANPKLAENVNYLGTKNLVELSRIPIIFASTGSVYGSVEGLCTEETPPKPLTEYAMTKLKAEREVQKHPNHVIYRFSTGFGLSPRPRLDLLVNDFVVRALKYRELIVFEKDYIRSFIHVKDMVRSLLFAIEHLDEMNGEIYNVGSEELCITKEEVALKIKEYVDYKLKFAEFGKDPDKRNYKVSFEKIESLGFKTKYSLDDGIKELMDALSFLELRSCYYNHRCVDDYERKGSDI
ncbi:MAG TPA: SDR family NAD-dependent epimerase/dehydratase [Thermoplasmatales archaeon]|nr:SDR family NAD-dependent epimerase/dehydratase [Thermoplasmatales archaeon]